MARIIPIGPVGGQERLVALLRGRCPRCRRAPIFRTFWTSHTVCPQCGLRFEREAGYFTGAMYCRVCLGRAADGVAGWCLL